MSANIALELREDYSAIANPESLKNTPAKIRIEQTMLAAKAGTLKTNAAKANTRRRYD